MELVCPECGGSMSLVDEEFGTYVCDECGYSIEDDDLSEYWSDKETEERSEELYFEALQEGYIEEEEGEYDESYEQVFDELDQALDID